MSRFKIEIPSDRKCCWNCKFAVFCKNNCYIKMCLAKKGRWYLPRTYKCGQFCNKELSVDKHTPPEGVC